MHRASYGRFFTQMFLFTFLPVSLALADGHDIEAGEVPKMDPRAISDNKVNDFRFCQVDSDCVTTVNGCCGCENTSVAKAKLEEFREQFDCEEVQCKEEKECEPLQVACILYRCAFAKDRPRASSY